MIKNTVNLLLIVIFLTFTYSCTKKKIFKDIVPLEASNLIEINSNNKDFIILDVRTKNEFRLKHLKNATNIDYRSNRFLDNLKKLDKSKKYLVYCLSGGRGKKAHLKMKELGFDQIYHLEGGINRWTYQKLPVTGRKTI